MKYLCSAVLAIFLINCGGATSPNYNSNNTGRIINLDVVVDSGNNQTARAGKPLQNALVVNVSDSISGKAAVGQVLNWVVTEGGGATFVGVTQVDSLGQSRNQWTLGTLGPQKVEVRWINPTTGDQHTYATFNATAVPPVCANICIIGAWDSTAIQANVPYNFAQHAWFNVVNSDSTLVEHMSVVAVQANDSTTQYNCSINGTTVVCAVSDSVSFVVQEASANETVDNPWFRLFVSTKIQ